jgi:diguanylate cyclase (GGDEF)-like protein/PAS domain S-box-containing protein
MSSHFFSASIDSNLTALLLGLVSFFLGYSIRQQRLKRALASATSLFEQASVAMARLSDNGVFLTANPKFCQIFGYTTEELRNLQATDLIHPDDRTILKNFFKGNSQVPKYLRYIQKNKTIIWCRVTIAAVCDRPPEAEYLLAIAELDNLQDLLASPHLKEKQEHLNNILNSLQDLVWSICLKTYQYIYLNDAAEKIYGRCAADFKENVQLWLEVIYPDDRLRVETITHQAIEQGIFKDIEYRIVRPNGEIRWIRDRAQPIADETGKIVRVDGIASDITEKKQAQARLERLEARNRAIIEAIPDVMFRVRRDGLCLDFIPPKETTQPLSQSLSSELLNRQLQAIERALATKEMQVYEQQIETQDGIAYQELRIAPSLEEEVLIFVRDITDRKKAEIDLQENEARLEQIINSISDGLMVVDRQGVVKFVNAATESLFGRDRSEFIDYVFGLPQVERESTEICIKKPTQEKIVVEIRTRNITWQGEVAYLISLRDITERDRAARSLLESEAKYRRIVETVSEGIWILDRNNKTSFVNPQMARMLGYTVAEMLGKSLFVFIDTGERAIAPPKEKQYRQSNSKNHDFKFRRKDGSDLWAIISATSIFDRDGNYAGTLGTLSDITERKQIEQAHYESEQRLADILSSIQDVVWSAAAETLQTLFMNLMAEKVFGRPAAEFYRDRLLWFKIVHPQDKKHVRQQLRLLHKTGKIEMEYRIVRPNGEVRWLYNRSRLVYDDCKKAVRIDGTDTDITERKQAEERLQYHAFYDKLTDLPNRALFVDRLEHALQRYKRQQNNLFAVLFLDLDGFKIINDSLGHLVGDRLLKAFARRLSDCLRPSDTLARLGGDEFTILVEDINTIKDAIAIAERILEDLIAPFDLQGQQVFTNTSIGIALCNPQYQRSEEILRDADTAMYRAKAQGKGCYAVFDRQMYHSVLSRLQLETDLRSAIEQQEFEIFYQPIFCLETNRITELEALIRWRHPKKGLISPAEFIPVAEETGAIVAIGQWILKEACRQLKEWQARYSQKLPLKVHVNLSGKQLKNSNFIAQIDEIMQETDLDPSSLKLEITESLLIENIEVATDLLLKLRERKIELCLDDFGTGYSSLSYLHRFPINTLKIDRSFVSRMQLNDESVEIVRAIVVLSFILGMNVIAEGIETKEQQQQLITLGCQKGQGYLLSKPLSKEKIELLLSSQK